MNERDLEPLRITLADRYAFEALLGRGAFASVFLVRNLKLRRREALKILSEEWHGDSDFARRFVAEAGRGPAPRRPLGPLLARPGALASWRSVSWATCSGFRPRRPRSPRRPPCPWFSPSR